MLNLKGTSGINTDAPMQQHQMGGASLASMALEALGAGNAGNAEDSKDAKDADPKKPQFKPRGGQDTGPGEQRSQNRFGDLA